MEQFWCESLWVLFETTSRSGVKLLETCGLFQFCCDSMLKGDVFEERVGVHFRSW